MKTLLEEKNHMRKLMGLSLLTEDTGSVEYKVVQRKDGKYEIHMKTGGGIYKDFNLPKSGTIWTNDGKGYDSKEEAEKTINTIDDDESRMSQHDIKGPMGSSRRERGGLE